MGRCAGTVKRSACVGSYCPTVTVVYETTVLPFVLKGASCLAQCTFNSELEVVYLCKRYRKYRTLEDANLASVFMSTFPNSSLQLPCRMFVFTCFFFKQVFLYPNRWYIFIAVNQSYWMIKFNAMQS